MNKMYLLVDNDYQKAVKLDFRGLKTVLIDEIVKDSVKKLDDRDTQINNLTILKNATFTDINNIDFIKNHLNDYGYFVLEIDEVREYLKILKRLYQKEYKLDSAEVYSRFKDIFALLDYETEEAENE